MKSVPLTAYPRTLHRRGGVRKLREAGRIPAVIYGRQTTPQNLEVDRKSLEDLIHRSASENLLVDLVVEKDAKPQRLALVQEVQHHALSGKVLHIDFHEITETETVTIMVPVEPVGEAAGVKTGGGVLEHVLFKVKVRCLAKDLPEAIHVDVTHLEIGQSVHLGEIKAPPNVEVLGDKKIPVLTVAAPITEAQEAAAEAAAAAAAPGEVEMIKEKKEEGEGPPPPTAKGAAATATGKAPAATPAGKGPAPADKAAAPAKAEEKKPAEKKK
jgi:large subunit ribosomal protein L25